MGSYKVYEVKDKLNQLKNMPSLMQCNRASFNKQLFYCTTLLLTPLTLIMLLFEYYLLSLEIFARLVIRMHTHNFLSSYERSKASFLL